MPLNRRQIVKILLGGGALAGGAENLIGAALTVTADTTKPVLDTNATRENFRDALALVAREEAVRGGYSAEAAQKIFISRLPTGCEFTIFEKGSKTSALVLHETERNKITVSLNTTDALSAFLNRFDYSGINHPLGGKVHKGFYTSIMERQADGQELVNAIKQAVVNYAKAASGRPVELDMTGFSRGGSMAVATAAQWMAEGFPAADSNIKFSSLYTFASPPLGDDTFNARFSEEAKKHNLQVWRVIGAGDPVPRAMTVDAWHPFFGKPYGHVGTPVYLFPSQSGPEATYLVDPSRAELAQKLAALKKPVRHDQDVYADLLGAPDAKMAPRPPRPEDRPQRSPAQKNEPP